MFAYFVSVLGLYTTVALFAAVVLLVCWLAWRNSRFVRLIDKIPGPKGIPIFGNIFDLFFAANQTGMC